MTVVKVVSSGVVAPEVETPKHRLWLSNLDLAAFRGYTPSFYVYRSAVDGGSPDFFSGERLKASLGKALVPFFPLAGRLVTGQDGRTEVSCNGEGVLFFEAESDSTIDQFGDFLPGPEMREMLVPSAPSADPPCLLLLLQRTSFKCGGVSLGMAVHHTVVDGLAAQGFVSTWAAINQGVVDDHPPPFLDRGLLRARSPPKVLFEHVFYRPPHDTREPPPAAAAGTCSISLLDLSEDQLSALKASSRIRLSTFKAVAAHGWRCLCKARGLACDEDTCLCVAVDARTHLDPPLPRGFLGNATLMVTATAKVGDVASDPVERTASKIHEATSRVGDEYVRSLVDFLQLQEDTAGELPSTPGSLPATTFVAISWLGLPSYEADFGWGKPAFMRRATVPLPGMAYVMHRPGNEGGVSVAVSLEAELMPAFKSFFYHGLGCAAGGISS